MVEKLLITVVPLLFTAFAALDSGHLERTVLRNRILQKACSNGRSICITTNWFLI